MRKRANSRGRQQPPRVRAGRVLVGFLLVAILLWTFWVYRQIDRVAEQDQARPADAIAVFGAAEYGGRPSPVFHARLDHAVVLFREKIAPMVITLGGGSNRDAGMTEGGVGRDYLLAKGIPLDKIIAETQSTDTEEQVRRLEGIARKNDLRSMVVVSDGTHLFRIQQLCIAAGLEVYTSPRPSLGRIDAWDLTMRYMHEIVSYTALRLHLDDRVLHAG